MHWLAQFKEGQSSHDTSNPLELPDDDATSKVNLFYVLHHHRNLIVDQLPGWFQCLAAVSDKYRCAERLKDFFHLRMLQDCSLLDTVSDVDRFIISFLTSNDKMFMELSNTIIRMPRANFEQLCDPDLMQLLPHDILGILSAECVTGLFANTS